MNSATSLSFIVYAPPYRDTSGGAIVLHKLCDTLNRLGYRARLWPLWKPPGWREALSTLPRSIAYTCAHIYRGHYITSPRYKTPLASTSDIASSIVIYPEIVSDNPLHARRYARWFLHRPGFHEGSYRYQDGDLYFCFQEAFKDVRPGLRYGGPLTVTDMMLDVYQRRNTAPRTRTAVMVRKGRSRPDLPDLRGQWVLDGLDHQQLAAAFDQCHICYFYDTHTVYAQYAAACGCIPVIVPELGVDKSAWIHEETSRYGLAYGEEEIPYAIATRDAMISLLQAATVQNLSQVRRFIDVVSRHFGYSETRD